MGCRSSITPSLTWVFTGSRSSLENLQNWRWKPGPQALAFKPAVPAPSASMGQESSPLLDTSSTLLPPPQHLSPRETHSPAEDSLSAGEQGCPRGWGQALVDTSILGLAGVHDDRLPPTSCWREPGSSFMSVPFIFHLQWGWQGLM